MNKKSRIYDEYKMKKELEKAMARELQEKVDEEIDLIKRYLDEEERFIKADQEREKKITDDELKRIQEEFKKMNEDILDPLKKNLDDLNKKVVQEEEIEEKGVQDLDDNDVLDEDDGIKQGIRVAFHNLGDL